MSNIAVKRIHCDVRELNRNPSRQYSAAPLEDNLFEWHFTLRGPRGSDFQGGLYHGRILLPPQWPMKPPSIMFLNASGRFEVGKKVCLSATSFHPEHWQPAWGIRTILEALVAFFPTPADGALGALQWRPDERRKLALESQTWRCPCCGPVAELVEGGADACVAARGAWAPAALAASLGAKSAPLKAADAPFSEESWAGLGTKGQLPLGAFLERPDEGLYLHDWSLPRNAPEALLDELRTPRWLRGDLLRRCGDDVPYAGAWPSLFVGAPGTRSTCHVDSGSLHFAMALVHGGAKKWRVWRREDAAFLYPRFAVSADDVLFDAARAGAAQPRWVVCQKPGDLVFVPSDCPHAVDNDGVTVGIATNFVDGSNVDAVAAFLADSGDAASLRSRERLLALAGETVAAPAKRARV